MPDLINNKISKTHVIAYLGTFGVLFCLAAVYKIPLSTDDFHWAIMLKQHGALPLFDDYFFRLPVWRVFFNLVFPILLKFPTLGKFLVWAAGFIGLSFPLQWFLKKYEISSWLLPVLALLTLFAPNQFEITFLNYCMPYCFGFLFVGLGFFAFRRNHRIAGTAFYLLSFLTLESFIVLVLLAEISSNLDHLSEKGSVKKIVKSLAPTFILYVCIRMILHFLNPYPYGVDASFKVSQVRGLIVQCFLIDFYKLNPLLSLLQLSLYGFLIMNAAKRIRLPSARIILLKKISIMALILFLASGYYFFLHYSARRALAGQIAFCWGAYLLVCLSYLSKSKARSLTRSLMAVLFISVQIANQARIFETKQFNAGLINEKIAAARSDLSKGEQTIVIDPDKTASEFKRDWIFADNQDIQFMFKFYLSPEEYTRLIFRKRE